MNPIRSRSRELGLLPLKNHRCTGGQLLRCISRARCANPFTAVDAELLLIPSTIRIARQSQQSGRNRIRPFTSRSDEGCLLQCGIRKQRSQPGFIKTVDMTPRWIRSSAMEARRSAASQILAIRDTDHDHPSADTRQLATCYGKVLLRNMLQHLGAKDGVEIAIRKFELSGVASYRTNAGLVELRFLKIERHHFAIPLGQQLRQISVAGTDVENTASRSWNQPQQVRNTSLFRRAGPVCHQVQWRQGSYPPFRNIDSWLNFASCGSRRAVMNLPHR
jgi:hypothetical protein